MAQQQNQSKSAQKSSSQQTLVAAHGSSSCTARPAHADIAKRAYEIYLKSGRKQGQCERNWMQAEQELCKQAGAASGAKQAGAKSSIANAYASGA
jgi:hypothetical protein